MNALKPMTRGAWDGPHPLPEGHTPTEQRETRVYYHHGRQLTAISGVGDLAGDEWLHVSFSRWPPDWRKGMPWEPHRPTDNDIQWGLDQFDPLRAFQWTERVSSEQKARHFFVNATKQKGVVIA